MPNFPACLTCECTCRRQNVVDNRLASLWEAGPLRKCRSSQSAVICAGRWENGIAHVCALAGYDVSLNDISRERIEAGLATINGNLARQ